MPAQDNTSDSLIEAVRRDAFLATSDDNWTPDRILGVANDCVLLIAAALKRTKQDWFQEDFEVFLEAGQKAYDVPETAMWTSIENAFLIYQDTGRIASELNNVSSSNRYLYQSANNETTGIPVALWLNQYKIVLEPAPDSNSVASYSMTVSAYRRPGQLVLEEEICRVVSVNSVTQTLTINALPADWVADVYTSGSPYRCDFYNRNLPNAQLLRNRTLTSPSATALVFDPSVTATEFASISPGDVVSMYNTSWYVDLPPEAVPYLRQMIQKVILTAQTDVQALGVYLGQKADEAANFIRGMANRHDGKQKKLSLYNSGASRFIRRARFGVP